VPSTSVNTPRARQRRLAVVGVLLSTGSLLLIRDPDALTRVIGYIGLIFFGLGSVLFITRLFRARPVVEIDADGLTDHATWVTVGRLRWSDIDHVEIKTMKVPVGTTGRTTTLRFLSVSPRDWDAVVGRANPVRRLFLRFNARRGYGPVTIMEPTLPYSLETLVDEMRRLNPRLVVETAER
jgi:hypothetical protein